MRRPTPDRSRGPDGRTRARSRLLYRRVELLLALRADGVGEFDRRPAAEVFLHVPPVPAVVAHLAAARADRQQPFELGDLLQRRLQLVDEVLAFVFERLLERDVARHDEPAGERAPSIANR